MRHGLVKLGIISLLSLFGLVAPGCGSGSAAKTDSFLKDLFPPEPGDVAREAFNVYDPDKRRKSVNLLSNAPWGGEAPYLKTYRLLVDDPDPTVRAACLRALGKHGEPSDIAAILPYLKDKTDFVRWEAAKALQRLHDPSAIDPLIEALRIDDAADVRAAAANALSQYPLPRVFQGLIGALNDDNYAVVVESQRALQTLTGEDFGEDGARWLAWSENHEQDLFARKDVYYYPQFVPPPTFWQKMQFWKQPKQIVPRQPTGVEETDPLFKKPDETAAAK